MFFVGGRGLCSRRLGQVFSSTLFKYMVPYGQQQLSMLCFVAELYVSLAGSQACRKPLSYHCLVLGRGPARELSRCGVAELPCDEQQGHMGGSGSKLSGHGHEEAQLSHWHTTL